MKWRQKWWGRLLRCQFSIARCWYCYGRTECKYDEDDHLRINSVAGYWYWKGLTEDKTDEDAVTLMAIQLQGTDTIIDKRKKKWLKTFTVSLVARHWYCYGWAERRKRKKKKKKTIPSMSVILVARYWYCYRWTEDKSDEDDYFNVPSVAKEIPVLLWIIEVCQRLQISGLRKLGWTARLASSE